MNKPLSPKEPFWKGKEMSSNAKTSYSILATLVIAAIALAACSPAVTITPTVTAAPTLQPGDSTRKVTVTDLERDYILHIPPNLDSLRAVPVVFAFHGWGTDGIWLQDLIGLDEIADTDGFLVVYPNGFDLSWNVGNCCGLAFENNVDEPAFVRQILADLGTFASIDPNRIYAMGYSNGALLSYRLACEMSDTFAAIAPVAGVMWYSPCEPTQPVSVLHVHGLEDHAIPYAGGESVIEGAPSGFPPVESGIATWAQLDGCTDSAQVDPPGTVPMTHTVYTACRAGSAVELYAIELLGHDWPETYVLPVSQVIWDFFAAHPKP